MPKGSVNKVPSPARGSRASAGNAAERRCFLSSVVSPRRTFFSKRILKDAAVIGVVQFPASNQ